LLIVLLLSINWMFTSFNY